MEHGALFMYADISTLYFVYIPPRKSIGIEYIPHSYQIPPITRERPAKSIPDERF